MARTESHDKPHLERLKEEGGGCSKVKVESRYLKKEG